MNGGLIMKIKANKNRGYVKAFASTIQHLVSGAPKKVKAKTSFSEVRLANERK